MTGSKKICYAIVTFSLLFSVWEWTFLLFASIALINTPSGGFVSAILFLSNAIVRVVLAKPLARFSETFNESTRIKISFFIKIIFFLLIACLPLINGERYALILWSLLVNVFLILDGYLSFHVRYHFAEAGHMSLTQFNSLINLGKRGGIAVASILAFYLHSWENLAFICLILTTCGIAGSGLNVLYFTSRSIQNKVISNGQDTNNAFIDRKPSRLFFGLGLLFIINLFFSSSALILTRAIEQYHLMIQNMGNMLTWLYIGFIVMNLASLKFDSYFSSLAAWKNIFISVLITSCMYILFFPFHTYPAICFLIAVVLGMSYGFSNIAFFVLISNKIKGANQASYYANFDSVGRFGFILSQLVAGYLLDMSIDPLFMLQLFGTLSLVSLSVVIFMYKKELKEGFAYDYPIA